jgi:hypothetical protein
MPARGPGAASTNCPIIEARVLRSGRVARDGDSIPDLVRATRGSTCAQHLGRAHRAPRACPGRERTSAAAQPHIRARGISHLPADALPDQAGAASHKHLWGHQSASRCSYACRRSLSVDDGEGDGGSRGRGQEAPGRRARQRLGEDPRARAQARRDSQGGAMRLPRILRCARQVTARGTSRPPLEESPDALLTRRVRSVACAVSRRQDPIEKKKPSDLGYDNLFEVRG